MSSFFIVSAELFKNTNWRASSVTEVAPVPIYSGDHVGNYAVNTDIFNSDQSFEAFRLLLSSLPIADLSPAELTPSDEIT